MGNGKLCERCNTPGAPLPPSRVDLQGLQSLPVKPAREVTTWAWAGRTGGEGYETECTAVLVVGTSRGHTGATLPHPVLKTEYQSWQSTCVYFAAFRRRSAKRSRYLAAV